MKKIIETLKGNRFDSPACWLMRQAGRYLPEYRQLRSKTKNFFDFCLNPELASQVTLQPLERFSLDAAIIFSDILVVPLAFGQKVFFKQNHGPCLEPIDFKNLSLSNKNIFDPVYKAILLTKSKMPAQKALIGFSGAPWTIACYMIEGETSRTFSKALLFSFENPSLFQNLMENLIEIIGDYLINQIKAGVEIIKLFDSWASVVPDHYKMDYVIKPTQKIVEKIKQLYPSIPIIGFPRGMGIHYKSYSEQTQLDCIALDQGIDLKWAVDKLPTSMVLQGALDPHLLTIGGDFMKKEIIRQKSILKKRPYIYNLGHGVLPQTNPDHVNQLLKLLSQ